VKKLKVLGQELSLKLSPSFLTNAACPKYLKLHYVDKVDDRYIRVAAERGSAAHAAIDELMGACQEGMIQPSSLSIEQVSDAVQKHTPHTILAELGEILAWCRLWAERYKISPHLYGVEEKVALDEQFEDTTWDNASYRGILDVIDIEKEHCTITDWKSQPHIMNQAELDTHEQLTMYCWLASKLYPHVKRFTARIWYLRFGFYAETTRSMEDLAAFEQLLLLKERKILEIDNWDPIPGKHCQYCDVIMHCPLAQDLSTTNTEVISQAQAIAVAQRITVMDALSKELKGKLKGYVKKNDAVMFGDKWVWGFRAKESIYWDVGDLAEVLAEYGHELTEVASVDSRKLKKLIKAAVKEDSGMDAELERIQKTKVRTTFSGYKQGDAEDEESEVE